MIYSVSVKPNSKENSVIVQGDGQILIRTTARAHDNEANESVVKLLSKHFKIPKTSIKILRGAKTRTKIIEISPL